MKSTLKGILNVLQTIFLIPIALGLLLLCAAIGIILIPLNYVRLFVLALYEVVRTVHKGETYEGRFIDRMTAHTFNFSGMLKGILFLPLVPWFEGREYEGHGRKYFEYERAAWIELWYISWPLALMTLYIVWRTMGFFTMFWFQEMQAEYEDRGHTIETQSAEIVELRALLDERAHEVDSLKQSQEVFYLTLDSIARILLDEVKIGKDSLFNLEDSLSIEPPPVTVELLEEKLEEQKTTNTKKSTKAADSPEKTAKTENQSDGKVDYDLLQEMLEKNKGPGKLCIRAQTGCSNTETKIFLNSQYLATFTASNPQGFALCGGPETFTKELSDGTYLIKLEFDGQELSTRVNIKKGQTETILIPCN